MNKWFHKTACEGDAIRRVKDTQLSYGRKISAEQAEKIIITYKKIKKLFHNK